MYLVWLFKIKGSINMNDFELTTRLKTQGIVNKLQKLECTLLGNRDDAWVIELLFKPGPHRYHLIEWMLSKLDYDVGKISGPRNQLYSPEERLKNLKSTVLDLGLCDRNSLDVIKGTAEVGDQLDFWSLLIDLLWLQYEIITHNSTIETKEICALPSENERKSFSEEFEGASACISDICKSVNIKHLFDDDVQLLSPDVERDIETLSPPKPGKCTFLTLKEMKNSAKEKRVNVKELYSSLSTDVSLSVNENEDSQSLEQLEEMLAAICKELKNTESSFHDVYRDFRTLILDAKSDAFTDIGPSFKNSKQSLEKLSELKASFDKIESTNSTILKLNSEIEDLLNKDSLSDEKYLTVLRLAKDEI